jgi:hypothetical protein
MLLFLGELELGLRHLRLATAAYRRLSSPPPPPQLRRRSVNKKLKYFNISLLIF